MPEQPHGRRRTMRYPFPDGAPGDSPIDQARHWLDKLWHHTAMAAQRLDVLETVHGSTIPAVARHFFRILEDALYLDAVLSVHKLFTPSTAERGIHKFLNHVEQNRADLGRLGSLMTGTLLAALRSQLDAHQKESEKVRNLRGEWLAHHRKDAFDSPQSFQADAYVEFEVLEGMLDTAKAVVRSVYSTLDVDVDFRLPGTEDAARVIDILATRENVRPRWMRDEISAEQAMSELFPNWARLKGPP